MYAFVPLALSFCSLSFRPPPLLSAICLQILLGFAFLLWKEINQLLEIISLELRWINVTRSLARTTTHRLIAVYCFCFSSTFACLYVFSTHTHTRTLSLRFLIMVFTSLGLWFFVHFLFADLLASAVALDADSALVFAYSLITKYQHYHLLCSMFFSPHFAYFYPFQEFMFTIIFVCMFRLVNVQALKK